LPFFFGERQGDRVELTGADARHLAQSLRARPGELISVVDPRGRLLGVRLDTVSPSLVGGRVETDVEHRSEPQRAVIMAAAMLPAQSLELVLSRCTEAGAAGFLLVQAERSVARGAKPERWATICREAAMLAGRLRVPEVGGPLPFPDAWTAAASPCLLDREASVALPAGGDELTLFVGPEGGWSDAERRLAGERRFTLGPRTLRADTAALVALALALG
jgi:16S rRNA (uracil1498-N3)-methyltransferase